MRLKRLFYAALAVAMLTINFGNSVLPVLAAGTDSSIQNPEPVRIPDGDDDPDNDIVLYKNVESVDGWANKWKITLRIEAPIVTVTSDTVLVIDHSASMSGSRLTNAKDAAKSLVKALLPDGNEANRVAVISYGTDVTTNTTFSATRSVVNNAIDGITATGGTFTQGGLREAVSLISTSTATYKNIILLSDGAPSYSYDIKNLSIENADSFDTEDGPGIYDYEYQTVVVDSADEFDYTKKVGDGSVHTGDPSESEMWDLFDRECREWGIMRCREYDYYYYNHGNAAIAEANFYKASGVGGLYTIAFNAGTKGQAVLNSMADTGKDYTATEANLKTIFDEIAGEISSLISNASVHDTMGQGVTVSGSGATSLDWEPEFERVGDKFVAEKSYEVEMDQNVYGQTSTDGFYALNESAVLTYNNGLTANFPVPKAKPFVLNVKKELVYVKESGNETVNGKEFKFKVTGGGVEKEYTVKSGEANIIKVPMPIKLGTEYTITETGATDESEIKFENYNIEYVGNVFTVTADHGDEIDVVIKNTYETTSVSASKVWDDDNDRDGIRDDYDDLYVVVKDGSNTVAKEALATNDKDYAFDNLPKYRNGAEISYTVGEAKCSSSSCTDFAGDTNYTVSVDGNNKITNKHNPATKEITIKKIWNTENGMPTTAPTFITVDLSNNENSDVQQVTLHGTGYGEWTSEAITVFVYKNHGEDMVYEVEETGIGGVNNWSGINKDTLYIYNGDVLEGKWVAEKDGALTVKNTWTSATPIYEFTGEAKFTIVKLDEDREEMEGVTFTVGETDYTTDEDGEIEITVPVSDGAEDSFTYAIIEKATQEGYSLVEGSATITVTCTSAFDEPDESTLTNKYTKTCTFSKEGSDKFTWDDDDKTLTVINNRSTAESMTIKKTFSGVSAAALSSLTFTITGPEDFGDDGEMTISFANDCTVDGSEATCVVDAKITTGEYTVKENDAEIEHFTLHSTGDNETKDVNEGDVVVFEIDNTYVVDTADYVVVKIWDDESDKDGIRPDSLTVNILVDEDVVASVDLSSDSELLDEYMPEGYSKDDVWMAIASDLPVADENAEVIIYYAEEVLESDDYEQTDVEEDDYVTTFTNTHEPTNVCGEGGGCGGEIPPIAPDTGRFTNAVVAAGDTDERGTNNVVVLVTMAMIGLPVVVLYMVKQKIHQKN